MISINIDKAKLLTKDRLRCEREPLLTQLDVDFQRSLETGEDTSLIVAEKQRLRDITLLTDNCSTLDELKSINCCQH